jgi:hypothetical protein
MAVTYHVTYNSTNGQPSNEFGTFGSRRKAIAAAREAVRTCLPERSGGYVRVIVGEDTDNFGAEIIWQWYEHPEGGFGYHRSNGAHEGEVRGLR